MNERERRIGKNEEVFRRVNEQIEQVNEAFGELSGTMTLVCECGDPSCIEQIHLTVPEYERLRADQTMFAIRPEHEIPDVEDVVERNDAYWVVRKHEGVPADVARDLGPER